MAADNRCPDRLSSYYYWGFVFIAMELINFLTGSGLDADRTLRAQILRHCLNAMTLDAAEWVQVLTKVASDVQCIDVLLSVVLVHEKAEAVQRWVKTTVTSNGVVPVLTRLKLHLTLSPDIPLPEAVQTEVVWTLSSALTLTLDHFTICSLGQDAYLDFLPTPAVEKVS